jgi:hypothetical protein
MAIKINRKLNLVLTLETDDGNIYIHSTPISRVAFEDNFLTISRTFNAIYANSLGPIAGPRVAALMLKQEATALGVWEKTQQSLMSEMYRLTSIILPGENGWETMPFDIARKRGIIDEYTVGEVENTLVYFMCSSAIHQKEEMEMARQGLSSLWGAQIISSNATEFMSSLPISIQEENTGENQTVVNQ